MSLETAILETLAYSDIFDYPLKIDELHRYLVVPASKDRILQCAASFDRVASCEGYYFLAGRAEVVDLRKIRASASQKIYERAVFYGRILGSLPFVRMVALTGSLTVMNLSKGADMDYMLVTQPGRLWTARAFAVTFGRLMRPFGHRICVNLLVSENALSWPVHDLYSAREMCQMIPITGMDVYRRLRKVNSWTESILPNSGFTAPNLVQIPPDNTRNQPQPLLESPPGRKIGEQFEGGLRKLQMWRLARRFGVGSETNFTADVCQANFHNHRQWADKYFHARLVSLGLAEGADELSKAFAAVG